MGFWCLQNSPFPDAHGAIIFFARKKIKPKKQTDTLKLYKWLGGVNPKILTKQTELKTQSSKGHKYYLLDKYVKLCNVTSNGEIEYQGKDTLEDIWNEGKKLKIKLKLGNCFIIYPIRLSFLHGKIFNFSSKNVILPNISSSTFSWENSHLGNIICSTDGFYSRYLQIKSKNSLRSIVPSIFPNLSSIISDYINSNINPNPTMKQKFKPLFYKLFGKLIKNYLIQELLLTIVTDYLVYHIQQNSNKAS